MRTKDDQRSIKVACQPQRRANDLRRGLNTPPYQGERESRLNGSTVRKMPGKSWYATRKSESPGWEGAAREIGSRTLLGWGIQRREITGVISVGKSTLAAKKGARVALTVKREKRCC